MQVVFKKLYCLPRHDGQRRADELFRTLHLQANVVHDNKAAQDRASAGLLMPKQNSVNSVNQGYEEEVCSKTSPARVTVEVWAGSETAPRRERRLLKVHSSKASASTFIGIRCARPCRHT